MTVMQAMQLGIGTVLAIGVMVFLMVAYFSPMQPSSDKFAILRFMCALCAGLSAILFAGQALFTYENQLSTGLKYAFSGTAGFALFGLVWFFFPRHRDQPATPPEAGVGFNLSIPTGYTFERAVHAIVDQDHALVELVGFSRREKEATLRPKELHTRDVAEALAGLRTLVESTTIRPYDVALQGNVYRLTVRK